MSARTLASAAAKTRTAARRRKGASLLYPGLPHDQFDDAAFWRAAFLRSVAQLRAAEQLSDALYAAAAPSAACHFLIGAIADATSHLRRDFDYWMQSSGGMVAQGSVV